MILFTKLKEVFFLNNHHLHFLNKLIEYISGLPESFYATIQKKVVTMALKGKKNECLSIKIQSPVEKKPVKPPPKPKKKKKPGAPKKDYLNKVCSF